MSWDRIQSETEAIQSLVSLYEQARRCRELYDRAQMALPEPLKRFLGLDQPEHKSSAPTRLTANIPAPQKKRPDGADADWLWVNARECSPTTLIPAVLRAASEPLSAKAVIEAVTNLAPQLVTGSIYNASTRLQRTGIINRSGGRHGKWELKKPETAAVIDDGFLWGAKSMFLKDELAAHRREAIMHVLKHFEMGLELVQIVEQLRNCSWVKAPVNKDLLKADVEIMEAAHKIRRRGNTRKWESAPVEKGE